jgi:benzoate-CoA ligase family protein
VRTVPPRYNVTVDLLDRNLEAGRAGKVALRAEGREVTYGELAATAARVAGGLHELGVEMEDRVLLLLLDSPEFAASYLGAMRLGAVAVPTNTALRAADFAYFLDESRAKVLIADASLWSEVQPALSGRPFLRHVVAVGGRPAGALAREEWLAGRPADRPPADTSCDDAAFWLWTSGSTGQPKAAVHLHHDWPHCCEGYAGGVLAMGERDVAFSAAKAFHAYGLGNGTVFPLYWGASSVYLPGRPAPAAVLELAQSRQPTLFFAVPTLYAAMLAHCAAGASYDLSSVRLCVSAGEPLPADIYRRWLERFGVEILDGIGSTEVLHIYLSPRAGHVRPGASGIPVDGYEVRIVDDDWREVPAGTVGDLVVRGASTAPFYWNRHELSQSRMRGPWFFSGDKYRRDDEGQHWYVGRSDDMFKVSGEWVSPTEVENVLIEHAAVLESAVVPYRGDDGILRVMAHVVLRAGQQPSEALDAELQALVRSRMPGYCVPRRILYPADLPKTAAGKIQRFRLRAEEGEGNG